MVYQLMDGVATARAIKVELRERVAALSRAGVTPGLGTLLVGDDPASRSYVSGKHEDCAEIGMHSVAVELPAGATEQDVLRAVHALNDDAAVTGFITQLPLPAHVDENVVLQNINPAKDADGLHPLNLGRLVLGDATGPLPCTPRGVLDLLVRYGVPLEGSRVVVIGRGLTVGKPLALLLARPGADATVTVVHSRTPDIAGECRAADIVIAAAGRPHLVKADWVKPGAAVVDVGVTRTGTGPSGRARLAGDVDPAVAEVAGWLSPNPGGVGPMTRAMLLTNVVEAAERRLSLLGVPA